MAAPAEVSIEIIPDFEASAHIYQSRPSNLKEEGIQGIFVPDIMLANQARNSLEFYGLPTVPAEDVTVNWIRKNSGFTENRGFVFLQVAKKCSDFQKFDSLSSNSKITVTASAYLKLLQFFSVKNDPRSEWMRIEKKMAQLLKATSSSTEIPMERLSSFKYM